MNTFPENLQQKLLPIAEKYFGGSAKNKAKVEVIINETSDLLSIIVHRRKKLNVWISLIEIKRFYEFCCQEKLVDFSFPEWYYSSIDIDENNFISFQFHLQS